MSYNKQFAPRSARQNKSISMGFDLLKREAIPQGLRRTALEQLQVAESVLEAGGGDPYEGIHQARISLKKVRALLRLLHSTRHWCRRQSVAIRDLGRELSARRDPTSMVEGLQRLSDRYQNGHDGCGVLARAREVLIERRTRLSSEAGGSLAGALAQLRALRAAVAGWPLADVDLSVLDKALAGSGRRARAALHELDVASSAEAFHELRKRVKVHLYQLKLTRDVSQLAATQDLPRLERLARLLGESQDLSLVLGAIAQDPVSFGDPAAVRQLRCLVETEQRRLQTKLLGHAREVFAPRAKEHHLEPTTQHVA